MPTKKQEVNTSGYGYRSYAKKTGYGSNKKKSCSKRKRKCGHGCKSAKCVCKPVKCVCKPVKFIAKKEPEKRCPEIGFPGHFEHHPEPCSEPSGTSCI